MRTIDELRAITSLDQFAHYLKYSAKGLSYIVYVQPSAAKYTTFAIPKISGGVRQIAAPEPRLKNLQRKLAAVLSEVDEETMAPPGRVLAHGFRKGYSIATNAKRHVGRRHVLNIDIEDFFPTFNFGRVRGFLIKHKDFRLPSVVATLICQIAFYNNVLPQGAPTSPVLTNLVGRFLDIEMVRLAKRTGSRYTRYADDITFSTNKREFPSELAVRLRDKWVASEPLLKAVQRAGFRLNAAKTRLSTRTGRQMVTGLTVNAKVNVPSTYYRYARAMAHSLFATGDYDWPTSMRPVDRAKRYLASGGFWGRMLGLTRRIFHRIVRWAQRIAPATSAPRVTVPALPVVTVGGTMTGAAAMAKLEGVLSYIWSVRRLDLASIEEVTKSDPTGIRKLYRQFLFFRHFHVNEVPTVITEGPTDIVYLKTAIRQLAAKYPQLAKVEPSGKITLKLRFLRHTSSVTSILRLTGGTDPIKKLIRDYNDVLSGFTAPGGLHPAIIVVDNDDGSKGATGIYGVLSNMLKIKLTVATGASPTRITRNLYLLSTPPLGASGASCIEDFFKPSTLATKLDGKSFNYKTDIDPSTEYGKVAFAEKVVLPSQAAIDFSGFEPILDRIVAAMEANEKVVQAKLAPTKAPAPVASPTAP